MTPMIIDNNIRKDIKKLIEFAWKKENIIHIAKMIEKGELKDGMPNPVGDKDGHTIFVPANFKVVYSIEDQGEGMNGKIGLGLCRHLSMSVGQLGRVPNPIGVDMVLEEFGFDHPIYECIFWTERFGGKDQMAINAMEPIAGWPEDLMTDVQNDGIKRLGQQTVMTIKQRRKQSIDSTVKNEIII